MSSSRSSHAGSAETVDWRPGVHSSELASVAVFDRDCRLTYVDQGNVAEFLPGGLDVFAALVDLRKHLKARCESEAAAIRARPGDVPDFVWGTPGSTKPSSDGVHGRATRQMTNAA